MRVERKHVYACQVDAELGHRRRSALNHWCLHMHRKIYDYSQSDEYQMFEETLLDVDDITLDLLIQSKLGRI